MVIIMGITGLIPFIEKASRRANVGEFSGCTVAIDSYCWLHKGAFACAEKLVRGEETDIHIKYCIKYVTMLLSKNIKPILVFDGRHLPAKAMTESKRRESRDISKKRAAELLSLGKIDEARSYIRRSVDITHSMALALIKECRKRNVDCIVAPYEADSQLAYLNIKNIAQLVITEDSDLILFGCTKVLFKMDLEGVGTLVETVKLPLVMKCPIEHYSFDKFRRMCIMSGCDYLASLPGIGLAKARQFVTTTQDPNFANALRKLPSYFNKMSLVVTDEYRESFLKAEATFRHQYVYDPLERRMVRLTEPDDEDTEQALCVNAGELLDPKTAFQLALGNLDPFTLKKMDDWHPDHCGDKTEPVKTGSWKDKGVSPHPSIWNEEFKPYLTEPCPWQKKIKKPEPIIAVPHTRPRKKVVNLLTKFVPETQDESISIQTLSNMYCIEPANKKQKTDCDNDSETFTQYTQDPHDLPITDNEITRELSTQKERSPILENKERSFKKCLRTASYSVLKKLSRFPRTVLDDNVVESKFFSSIQETSVNNLSKESITIEESPERRNPFKAKLIENSSDIVQIDVDSEKRNLIKANLIENSTDIVQIDSGVDKNESPERRNPIKVTLTQHTSKTEDIDVISNSITTKVSPSSGRNNPFKVKLPKNGLNIMEIEKQCPDTIKNVIFKDKLPQNSTQLTEMDTQCSEVLENSQKENSPMNSPVKSHSPILKPSPRTRIPFRSRLEEVSSFDNTLSEESVIENTYPMETLVTPVDSQTSYGESPPDAKPFRSSQSQILGATKKPASNPNGFKKSPPSRNGLKRTTSLPSNQPTLLSMFGFQKKPVLKR